MISNSERVLRTLARLRGVATGREIAQMMGDDWNERRVGQAMRVLIPSGKVERLAVGVYRIKGHIPSKR